MMAVVLAAVVMAVPIAVFGWLADTISRINLAKTGMVCAAAIYGVLFTPYMSGPSASAFPGRATGGATGWRFWTGPAAPTPR
jgi:hypothetical protein